MGVSDDCGWLNEHDDQRFEHPDRHRIHWIDAAGRLAGRGKVHVAVRSGGSRACATADVECAGDSDTTGSWNQSASSIADDEYRFRNTDCASHNDLTTGHDDDATGVWQPATT